MKHIKIILSVHIISSIIISVLTSTWYTLLEGKSIINGFIVLLPFILLSLPTLIFIICYHFILVYFKYKLISASVLIKIGVILLLNIIYASLIFFMLSEPFTSTGFIKHVLISLGLNIVAAISYELVTYLFKKWNL